MLMFYVQQKYLAAQDITRPPVWCALTANITNAVGGYLLLSNGFDFSSIAYCTAGSQIIMSLLLFISIRYWHLHRRTYVPFRRKEVFVWKGGIREFLGLGFAGAAQLMLEFWGTDILTVFSGYLNDLSVAAHAVLFNIWESSFCIP